MKTNVKLFFYHQDIQLAVYKVTMYFSYGTYMLGTAWGFGDYEQSNFKPASAWIS